VCAAIIASDGETVPSLGAAGTDNRASATGSHADEKAMRAFAADDGRLVSAFHDSAASIVCIKRGIIASKALFVETILRCGVGWGSGRFSKPDRQSVDKLALSG
jgi:hypothetical protein